MQPDEWIYLSSNFTDYRLNYEVLYGSTNEWRPWNDDRLPDASLDQSGTGAMGTVDLSDAAPNKTWAMVINNVNATSPGWWHKYTTVVNALQCPRIVGCPLPPKPVLGVFSNWSNPKTWPSGVVPVEGDTVVITNVMSVYLDVSPPPLAQLTIEGQLWFVDDSDKTLSVGGIVVFGELQVGNVTHPFKHRGVIQLNGVRTSPTVVVDNAYFLGNKVMAVFGRLSLAGLPRAVTWTKLGALAAAGSTSITLAQPVDWRVGDEIVITPTEFNSSHLESALVTSVSPDNLTLGLDRALAHTHTFTTLPASTWAGSSSGRTAPVVLAAAVGLLNRNVVVLGSDIDAATPGYGATMTVGNLARNGNQYLGVVNISFAQLHHCGQLGMDHAALTFSYGADLSSGALPVNTINGSSFSYSLNYAIVSENAKNLVVRDNVFHRTYRTSLDFDDQVGPAFSLMLTCTHTRTRAHSYGHTHTHTHKPRLLVVRTTDRSFLGGCFFLPPLDAPLVPVHRRGGGAQPRCGHPAVTGRGHVLGAAHRVLLLQRAPCRVHGQRGGWVRGRGHRDRAGPLWHRLPRLPPQRGAQRHRGRVCAVGPVPVCGGCGCAGLEVRSHWPAHSGSAVQL